VNPAIKPCFFMALFLLALRTRNAVAAQRTHRRDESSFLLRSSWYPSLKR
jgi:hypothetical protein